MKRVRSIRVFLMCIVLLASTFLGVGAASAVDIYEVDSLLWPTSIDVDGTMQSHDIDPAGDSDWISFFMLAGCRYTIETHGPMVGKGIDTALMVSGNGAYTDDDGGAGLYSRIVVDATTPMRAYAAITGYSVEATGGYQINVIETDYAPPVTTDNAPAGWQNADVDVMLSVSDNVSGVFATYYTIDGSSTETYTGTPVVISDPGVHMLSYWSVDAEGNIEPPNAVPVLIDKQAPVTAASAPMGWNVGVPLLTLTPTDDLSGVLSTYFQVDSGPPAMYPGAPVPFAKDGTYDISYWSIDVAGNVEDPGSLQIFVDNTAPSVTDDAPLDWQPTPVTVTLTATDRPSGVAGIDTTMTPPPPAGTAIQAFPGDLATLAVTEEGTTTILYSAYDMADNRSGESEAQVRLDFTGPTVSMSADPTWASTPVTVTVEATDPLSGVDEVYFSVDDGAPRLISGSFWFGEEGYHELEAWAFDNVGNESGHVTTMVAVDFTAPVTTDDALAEYVGQAVFNLTAFDEVPGLADTRWRLDGGSWNFGTVVTINVLGAHTIEYYSTDIAGNVEAMKSVDLHIFPDGTYRTTRVWGRSRYSSAVSISRLAFDPAGDGSWPGVTDVIIACGLDRAAADPLAASGLVWAYNGPLFLVDSASVPDAVLRAVSEISASAGTKISVHIAGGTNSVPNARVTEIVKAASGGAIVDRIRASGTRFDLSSAIADRVAAEWQSREGTMPPVVLVANGADSSKFFDALSLSPIAAAKGYPILLVAQREVPAPTLAAIKRIGPDRAIVAGGRNTVSDAVLASLHGERWSGRNRYETATRIADKAVAEGWLAREQVGVAVALPDAYAGGSMVGLVGRDGGVLVLSAGDSLTASTGSWLARHEPEIKDVYLFGGPASASEQLKVELEQVMK